MKERARFLILTRDWKKSVSREFALTTEMRTVVQNGDVSRLPDDKSLTFRLDLPNDPDTLLEFVEIRSE